MIPDKLFLRRTQPLIPQADFIAYTPQSHIPNGIECVAIILITIVVSLITSTMATSNGIANPKVRWKFKTQGTIRSAATWAGNYLYVGSADGFLYALNKNNGSLRWKFESQGAIAGAAAVAGELVIFSSRDNYVYALHSQSGELVWKFKMENILPDYTEWEYFTAAPVVSGTTVLVGSGDGHVYALDTRKGKLLWKYKTGGRIRATPLVLHDTIYQPSNDGIVYVLSVTDGTLLWKFKTEGASLDKSQGFDRTCIFSKPCLKDNILVFGSRDGKTYAVDITTHQKKWQFTYGSTWAMSTALDHETVFVGWSTNRKFSAIDLKTGKEKWSYDCGSVVYSTALVRDDQVVVGSADGNLYAFDKGTGKKVWEYFIGAEIHASPVADESTIYVGSDDGYLYALEEGQQVYTAVYQPIAGDKKADYPILDPNIAPYLKAQGFQQLDSALLYKFVSDRIQDKALSVIVFAYDVIPPNIMGEAPENGMIRKYLESGGKILWLGGVPNMFGFDSKGKFQRSRDVTIATRLLDVDFISPEESGNYFSRATQQGLNWGLPVWLKTTHASVAPKKVVPLAFDENNRVSAWIKKFNDRAGSAFISCRTWAWDVPIREEDLKMIYRLAMHELR